MCVHSKYFIIVLFNKTQYCVISFYHFQSVYTRVYVLISFTKLGPWLGFIGNMQIVHRGEAFILFHIPRYSIVTFHLSAVLFHDCTFTKKNSF